MGGALFICLGMIFIIANKLEYQKSILPMSVHSITGCVVLLVIAVQAVSGQEKIVQLDNGNKRVRRWHGDSGLLLWDLLCLTMIFGLISFLSVSFATCLVLLSVVMVWLAVHAQMLLRTNIHKYDSSNSMDDSPVAGFGASNHSDLSLARDDSFGTMDVESGTTLDGLGDADTLITNSAAGADDTSRNYDN